MKAVFPNDSRLPQLPLLLNEAEMIKTIGNALGITILSAKPVYIRYKPETSCIVQYTLGIEGDEREPITRNAHIKVYADHRALTKVRSGRAKRMDKRLEGVQPQARKVAYLPEIDGALQVYPLDLDLRGLARVANIDGARRMLRNALDLPESPKISAEPELVRYKPGRKALLRYHVQSVSNLPLYGKVFESISVTEMRDATNALIAAGVRTARVLGVVEEHNFVVHETAPGIALKELRHSDEYSSWMKPLADTLWQLHSVDTPSLANHTLQHEIDSLSEIKKQISHLIPGLANRVARLDRVIAQGLRKLDDTLVTSHGDFYDDQALVGDDGLTLIDLEALRRSHPLIDAGNMLGHLSAATMRGEAVSLARQEFWNLVLEHTGADPETVSLFEAAAILRLAPGPFRRLEANWPVRVESLVSLAEARLLSYQVDRITDPHLPQLDQILDVAAISAPVSEVAGFDIPSVTLVEIVRHKPGRRAIVRIHLSDSRKLYGKTFASKRGPKVFDITKAISSAQALGPDVLTPDAVGYVPELKLMLLSEVKGEPVEDALGAGDTDLAERIAFALYHLHSSDVDLGRWHDLEKELSPLENRCLDICKHAPTLANAAETLLHRIEQFDHQHLCWRFRPVHRDMYHDQLLLAKEHLVVLDLDDASMSEPAVDVANFAAHLILAGIQRDGDAAAFQPSIDAFLEQYGVLDRDLDPILVNYLIATTLFRLAGIHVSRTNGKMVARMLIETANRHLQSAGSLAA